MDFIDYKYVENAKNLEIIKLVISYYMEFY